MTNLRPAFLFVALLMCAPFVAGCDRSHPPQAGGATNWLRSCDSDADCGDIGSCVCGLCSERCMQDDECSSGLSCQSSESALVRDACGAGAKAGLCSPQCKRDSECAGKQSCVEGACAPVATGVTDTADASTGTDSGGASPKCGAAPTKLIDHIDLFATEADANDGISASMDLAVNATDLYAAVNYNNDGALWRVPIHGGQPSLMTRIDGTEQGLLVTGDSVVFVQARQGENDDQTGEIVRVGLQGGDTTILAMDQIAVATVFGPSGVLDTDGRYVYFAALDGAKRVALAGGAVQTLTSHTGSVAVAGSKLLIADGAAGDVFSVPLAGGDATTLASNLTGYLGPVMSCGMDVCWASMDKECAPGSMVADCPRAGRITRLDPNGTATPITNGPGPSNVHRLVFDGGDFFGSVDGGHSAGGAFAIPASGGAVASMASGTGLAVDDECVYVGDVLRGVYSLDKSYRGDALP